MKLRQSNIELLRILSMMAVIMVHLDGASVGLPTPGSITDITGADAWRIVVESITIVGVNCFTLISGYFGIRARLRGLITFTLTCLFYSVIIYSLQAALEPQTWSWERWIESWMVFTHTDLWYVPAYLVLYLLSPMLNAATAALTPRQSALWIGLFVLFNVWGGWLWGMGFNPTGYTPVQLIMMYLIGRHIATERDRMERNRRRTRFFSIAAWGISTLLTAIVAIWMEPTKAYAYNAPWVLISSVAVFTFFTTIRIHSQAVNFLARGAFAAYLIHKNPIVWVRLIRPAANDVWDYGSLLLYSAFCLSLTLTIYLISCVADALRRRLFNAVSQAAESRVRL